jgi:hypothetical protein
MSFAGKSSWYWQQRERSEIMKADGLLISAEELPWRKSDFRLRITAK